MCLRCLLSWLVLRKSDLLLLLTSLFSFSLISLKILSNYFADTVGARKHKRSIRKSSILCACVIDCEFSFQSLLSFFYSVLQISASNVTNMIIDNDNVTIELLKSAVKRNLITYSECKENICFNGGVCWKYSTGFVSCACPINTTGYQCEYKCKFGPIL